MNELPVVTEQTVTVRTLKIGKKQFTSSMFKQLNTLDSVFTDQEKTELRGAVWGYVNHSGGTDLIVEVQGTLFRCHKGGDWDRVTSAKAIPHTQEGMASMAEGALGNGKTRAERAKEVEKMRQANLAAAEKYQKVTDAVVRDVILTKPQFFI